MISGMELTQWPCPIPVGERLPEPQESVLIWFQNEWWCAHLLDYHAENKNYWKIEPDDGEEWITAVSHWLPLPPAIPPAAPNTESE